MWWKLTTVVLCSSGVWLDWVVVASQGDSRAHRCSSAVERRLALEVLRFRYSVFSLGPRFKVGPHSEPSVEIAPSHTVALLVNQFLFHSFLCISASGCWGHRLINELKIWSDQDASDDPNLFEESSLQLSMRNDLWTCLLRRLADPLSPMLGLAYLYRDDRLWIVGLINVD